MNTPEDLKQSHDEFPVKFAKRKDYEKKLMEIADVIDQSSSPLEALLEHDLEDVELWIRYALSALSLLENSFCNKNSDFFEVRKDFASAYGFELNEKSRRAFLLFGNELDRAVKKFPCWPNDPLHAVAILNEEVGELNKALLECVYEKHKATTDDVEKELIQVGAMVLRFFHSLDRYIFIKSIQHKQREN